MTSNPSLHDELDRIAATQPTFRPDPTLWDRGRRARRRTRLAAGAAALAVVALVAGIASPSLRPDPVWPAGSSDPDGAIPSEILDFPRLDEVEADLAIGQGSVAFVTTADQAVVIGATDGRYHVLDLPGWDGGLLSLSPDGTRLVWTFDSETRGRPIAGIALTDLTTGETSQRPAGGPSTNLRQVSWSPSGTWLTWSDGAAVSRMPVDGDLRDEPMETSQTKGEVEWTAVDDDGVVTLYVDGPRRWQQGDGALGRLKLADDAAFGPHRRGRNDFAVASPTGRTVALASTADAAAADFLAGGRFLERPLQADLYPEGAAVRPLGWATDTLVLAQVDAPDGSYVEGRHLALLTSPDLPESEWTYRIVMRGVPDVPSLSIAVDLVPDLDGTSSQQLTRDFGQGPGSPSPWAGRLGALAGLLVLVVAIYQVRRAGTRKGDPWITGE